MPAWKHTLDLTLTFHNDELSLEQKTSLIAAKIKSRPWYEEANYNGELELLLEEMVDAGKENNVDHFDAVWDFIYDIFDADKVWVKTQ